MQAIRGGKVFCAAAALVLAAVPCWGQGTSGTILGTVADPTGGVVPDVKVTVLNLETNAERTTTTDVLGTFRFAGLPIGSYRITAEKAGFSKYVQGPVTLTVNQQAEFRITLQVGAVAETVQVSTEAPLLNTTTAEVGVRFDERRISELPLTPNRNILQLALSVAGVSQLAQGQSEFAAGGVAFSVNGMRTRGNNFMVDGQDSNDPSVSGLIQEINNPDLVAEFRLVTNQFSPEFGRSAGSVVNIVTKSGTNSPHGSAFWFHNDNHLNSRNNQQEVRNAQGQPLFEKAPYRVENQFGGTAGGPLIRDKTFLFGSLQRWTDRQLGTGTTINGVPTEAGRQLLQSLAGNRPQVQALLRFLPAAQAPLPNAFANATVGTRTERIPLGSLSGSIPVLHNDWQWSGRVDHRLSDRHQLGGRYLHNDRFRGGFSSQATPPGYASVVPSRRQAATAFLTSTVTPHVVNEFRASYQRLGTTTTAADPSSETIPSIEIPELGLTGFNAAQSRTAIGLAVNLPQFRFNNTYQLQDTVSWIKGTHALKFGLDFRRNHVKSFFFPTVRGLLRYPTLQRFIDDNAEAANINKPLPGGDPIQYYEWDDYFWFIGDEWRVKPSLTLSYGIRYESHGQAVRSLLPMNQRIIAAAGGDQRYALFPVPNADRNNFQPRFGFNWAPRTSEEGFLGKLTGGNKLVFRGGYSRTNDYAFINIALNVASSFPFVAAINNSNFQDAFVRLPNLVPTGLNPNTLTRTIVADDFRSPIAEQFSSEIQREFGGNWVARFGWIATKGTGLFQTIDGNPAQPRTSAAQPLVRVDPTRGVIRLRANAASSIYHAFQTSLEKRLSRSWTMAAHYTWSAFIDDASEIFNPAVSGDVAVSQDSFNRRADRGRSTYDRPHRFTSNFVYELPWMQNQPGAAGRILGGWQINGFVTAQAGPPFTPLAGVDPTGALAGIDGLVGNSIRPNLNTSLDLSSMKLEDILLQGGRTLFSPLVPGQRVGLAGRNILRGDGILNIDFGVIKNIKTFEGHRFQVWAAFYNLSNTRNFGIPESRINSVNWGNQWGSDGGNRRVVMALRYVF
jgi:hypothetical protein